MQALSEPSQAYDKKSFSFVTSSATEMIIYDAPTCVTQGAPLIYTRVGQPSARILRLMRTPNAPVVTRQRTPSAQAYRAHGDVQQGTVRLTQRWHLAYRGGIGSRDQAGQAGLCFCNREPLVPAGGGNTNLLTGTSSNRRQTTRAGSKLIHIRL